MGFKLTNLLSYFLCVYKHACVYARRKHHVLFHQEVCVYSLFMMIIIMIDALFI